MSPLLIAAGALVALVVAVRSTERGNRRLRAALEDWDISTAATELARTHRALFRPDASWRPVFERDGARVDVGWCQPDPGARRVRLYRTLSHLDAGRISIDRMLELLDGGFLEERVWYDRDFKGGEVLRRSTVPELGPVWVARYVSDLNFPPFRHRQFVYLVMRRELPPEAWVPVTDRDIVRQAIIGYRSVAPPDETGPEVVAQQYPSLDRLTLTADGCIIWEHLMCFHLGGRFPLWLTNRVASMAARTMWHEAINMRAHLSGPSAADEEKVRDR